MKKLQLKKDTLRVLGSAVRDLARVRGGADSGGFTETGTGLCVTAAQYSCVSVAAGCA